MKASYAIARTYYACHNKKGSRFPNSAARKHFWERFVEITLAAALTASMVAILLFLLVFF